MELVRGSDVMVTWEDEGGNSEEVEGSLVWQDSLLVLQRARHNPDPSRDLYDCEDAA